MEDRTERFKFFGQRVRHYRELRGWQLDDLASRLGKARASMSRIENGKQNLSLADILAIADALEVPEQHLFPSHEFVDDARHATLTRCAQGSRDALHILARVTEELEGVAML